MSTVEMLITSGVVGAIVTTSGILISEVLKRHWKKRDAAEDKEDRTIVNTQSIQDITGALKEIKVTLDNFEQRLVDLTWCTKTILFDRIKYLCLHHLEEGEITFENRRIIHNLHKAYHDHCNGNGDLDLLIQDVDSLPLK